jgi:hypothetical protein
MATRRGVRKAGLDGQLVRVADSVDVADVAQL